MTSRYDTDAVAPDGGAGDVGGMGWAIPVMQAGYGGRGLVYTVVAGLSLWSIWQGGAARGTSSAFGWLESTAIGLSFLVLIFFGMLAYFVWRVAAAIWDLEDYGGGGKGAVARIGMAVTGLVHLGLGAVALSLLFAGSGGSGGEGGTIPRYVGMVMQWPMGRWIVGAGAVATILAGAYYVRNGVTQSYRRHLHGTAFTERVNPALRIGLIAQGAVVGIVGLLFLYAAVQADPNEAGGVDAAFAWLNQQIYGQVLVTLLCVGLLAFALFCFVNAAQRVVPRASGDGIVTLAARATRQAAT